MYNSDMDYGRNSQDDGFTDDFTDDFSDGFTDPSDDNFFNDDNFDNQADTPRTSGTRFKRASVVSPEPINLSDSDPMKGPFDITLTPITNPSPESIEVIPPIEEPLYQEIPEQQETPAYQEIPEQQEAPAYQEIPEQQEAPAYQEAPQNKKSAAQMLIEYADCQYKLIPAGTNINEFNRKYIYSLNYGNEWGFSTVILPVLDELANRLCFDQSGNLIEMDRLRDMRRDAMARLAVISGTDDINEIYRQKTDVIASKGISIDRFEQSDDQGAAINCFSTFVKNGVTSCDVLIAMVPSADPWNVFAWFPVGGFDGMPTNDKLTAASKHWYQLCGAVPAVISYNTIEYFVPNGKPTYDAALQIAREQFAVCHERVLRLTRSHSLGELVNTLMKSCVWYLGWR